MMRPGRNFIHATIRLEARFYDDDDDDTDPTTVTCRVMRPCGAATTYTYDTDDNLGRTSAGDYYCDFTPDETGRWFYRWAATGVGVTIAHEGTLMVDYSPHYESRVGYRGGAAVADDSDDVVDGGGP